MFKKLAIMAVATCLSFVLQAAVQTVDGTEWNYAVSDGKAEIYQGGWEAAISTSTAGEIKIPASLGGYPVTSIGDYAFYYCSGLTSVTIPESERDKWLEQVCPLAKELHEDMDDDE